VTAKRDNSCPSAGKNLSTYREYLLSAVIGGRDTTATSEPEATSASNATRRSNRSEYT
jgi:hypothetical protein